MNTEPKLEGRSRGSIWTLYDWFRGVLDDFLLGSEKEVEVDWFIFGVGFSLLLLVILPIIFFPDASRSAINQVFEFLTETLGIVYIIAANAVLVLLLWIAMSRRGKVVLGSVDKPAYSGFSWAAMLFCAGIGASLIYWGAAEWVFYYVAPPFGVEPKSSEAIKWAISYGIFHWGPVGWALYCLPAVALSCSYHVKQIPSLRLSDACEPVLKQHTRKWPGRVIDLLFIIGLLGTGATGLGFGTSVVASAVSKLTGMQDGIEMQLSIIAIATLMIAYSVSRGMDAGIKVLSNINAVLALLLIGFVLLVGPTRFILETSVVAVGTMVQNFVTMLTWTDPLEKSSFVENWTVFYWAWWMALGPFVGMFVCKISEGRTVRSVIFGMLGWGTLGCILFFLVLGNYALFLEVNGIYPVVQEVMEVSPSTAISSIIELLPLGSMLLVYLAIIGLIFMATSYDSASYVLAAGASKRMGEHDHPPRWHRVFWAFALGILPVGLLLLEGLRMLQTASVVASIPLLVVYVFLSISAVKTLGEFS